MFFNVPKFLIYFFNLINFKMPGTPSHKIGYLRNKLNYCRVGNESKRFEEPDDFEINKIDGEYIS